MNSFHRHGVDDGNRAYFILEVHSDEVVPLGILRGCQER